MEGCSELTLTVSLGADPYLLTLLKFSRTRISGQERYIGDRAIAAVKIGSVSIAFDRASANRRMLLTRRQRYRASERNVSPRAAG